MERTYQPEISTPREVFHGFDPDTRAPSRRAPPGSCDAQIHVFGDLVRYPVRREAVFGAPDATFSAARRMHAALGIDRCVIVQSTVYGYEHSCMLDALAEGGPQYRGCAMIDDRTTDGELRRLHDAGVRGVRFNFFAGVNLISDPAQFARAIARIAEMGWYAKLHPATGGFLDLIDMFRPLRLPVLVDHYGRPAEPSASDPSIRAITDLMKGGNWWMMISNAHRFSRHAAGWDDMIPVARAYIDAAPSRIVWASDWPHPLARTKVPNDADLLEFLYRATDEAEQQAILVDNPASLFGFAE